MMPAPQKSAETILVESGVIAAEQARAARERLAAQGAPPDAFPEAVAALGYADDAAVLRALSKAWNLPFDAHPRPSEDFLRYPPFLNYLTFDAAKARRVLPLRLEGGVFHLGCLAPPDFMLLDDLRMSSGAKDVRPVLILAGALESALASVDPAGIRMGPGSVAWEWDRRERRA